MPMAPANFATRRPTLPTPTMRGRRDPDECLLGFLFAEDHVDLSLELGATIFVGGAGKDDDGTGLSHADVSPFAEDVGILP